MSCWSKCIQQRQDEYKNCIHKNTASLGYQKALRRNILASAFGTWNQTLIIANLSKTKWHDYFASSFTYYSLSFGNLMAQSVKKQNARKKRKKNTLPVTLLALVCGPILSAPWAVRQNNNYSQLNDTCFTGQVFSLFLLKNN